jgi:hypothetical protein
MRYQPHTTTPAELPSPEQLAEFRIRHGLLLYGSSAGLTPEQKQEVYDLLLNLDPFLIERDDIELLQKNCPELWKDYCDWHWGGAEWAP